MVCPVANVAAANIAVAAYNPAGNELQHRADLCDSRWKRDKVPQSVNSVGSCAVTGHDIAQSEAYGAQASFAAGSLTLRIVHGSVWTADQIYHACQYSVSARSAARSEAGEYLPYAHPWLSGSGSRLGSEVEQEPFLLVEVCLLYYFFASWILQALEKISRYLLLYRCF